MPRIEKSRHRHLSAQEKLTLYSKEPDRKKRIKPDHRRRVAVWHDDRDHSVATCHEALSLVQTHASLLHLYAQYRAITQMHNRICFFVIVLMLGRPSNICKPRRIVPRIRPGREKQLLREATVAVADHSINSTQARDLLRQEPPQGLYRGEVERARKTVFPRLCLHVYDRTHILEL